MSWQLLRDSLASADDDWRALGTLPPASILAKVGVGKAPPSQGVKFTVIWTDANGVHVPGAGSINLTPVEIIKVDTIETVTYGQTIVATANLLYTFEGVRSGRFTVRVTSPVPHGAATRYRLYWGAF